MAETNNSTLDANAKEDETKSGEEVTSEKDHQVESVEEVTSEEEESNEESGTPELKNFDPEEEGDLVAFEGQKVLIYAIDHGNYANLTLASVRKTMLKTIEKGPDWGGDIVLPITIGKTKFSKKGIATVPFTSEYTTISPKYDYLTRSDYFGGWIWSNYERLFFLLTDPSDYNMFVELWNTHKNTKQQQEQQQKQTKEKAEESLLKKQRLE